MSQTACREWKGPRNPGGYGLIWLTDRKKQIGSHRFAWAETNGPIPEGMHVLHTCDNPLCYNPDHLFLGTPADNMADKVAKGRQAKGSRLASAKLNEEKVKEIRRLYKAGGTSHRALAREFGVSKSLITQILNREWWAHVP